MVQKQRGLGRKAGAGSVVDCYLRTCEPRACALQRDALAAVGMLILTRRPNRRLCTIVGSPLPGFGRAPNVPARREAFNLNDVYKGGIQAFGQGRVP